MRIVAAFFISLLVLASCGPSLTQTCEDYAKVWCAQQYKCQTGTALANLQTQYGATADDCANVYGSCATAQSPCGVGTSYDTGQAETCVTEYGKQQCSDILQNAAVDACQASKICH